jgi:hypothetical protein
MKKIALLTLTLLIIISCSKPNKSAEVYLEKNDMFTGEWTKTALMFGYYDNYDACIEIKTALSEKYPDLKYRCLPK